MAPTGEKMKRARAYILAHPHETKKHQAEAIGVSRALIANAREALITEGLLGPSRKGPPSSATEPPRAPADRSSSEGGDGSGTPRLGKPAGMLDHDAMLALGSIVDTSALVPDDDAEVHRKLLRQCLSFAFNTTLHPDTRMSASQMWAKLRDLGKSSQLGPGVPLTREAAIARVKDLVVAVGPEIILAAINEVFEVKETTDGEAKDDQAAPAVGTPPAPGPA